MARCVEEVRAGDRLADSILTAVYRYSSFVAAFLLVSVRLMRL